MSEIEVPSWFSITEIELWRDTLAEHQTIIERLRDDRSDEIGLLLLYRRFLQRRRDDALLALLEFMSAYALLVMRSQRPRFAALLFERIVKTMSPPISQVLKNPGFIAVAAAIRRATVSAQAQKAMKMQNYREIRYDLLPELRRKRTVPGPAFLEAVSDFVALYNAENGKRRERNLPTPPNVTTEQFAQFAALLDDESQLSVIGALLCAYASCRAPKETQEPDGKSDIPESGGDADESGADADDNDDSAEGVE